MNKQSAEIILLFEYTISEFKALIDDPDGNLESWKDYGYYGGCRFCIYFYTDDVTLDLYSRYYPEICNLCPLNECTTNESDILTELIKAYHDPTQENDTDSIVYYAKLRLDWIKKKYTNYANNHLNNFSNPSDKLPFYITENSTVNSIKKYFTS